MEDHSTKKLSKNLFKEIEENLKDLEYGSVELYVQNGIVTQITKRLIKKIKLSPLILIQIIFYFSLNTLEILNSYQLFV